MFTIFFKTLDSGHAGREEREAFTSGLSLKLIIAPVHVRDIECDCAYMRISVCIVHVFELNLQKKIKVSKTF